MKIVPIAIALAATLSSALSFGMAADIDAAAALSTRTPIKQLFVVAGENVSFDTLFGTYTPSSRESIHNLLPQRIVNANGSPGPDHWKAAQYDSANQHGRYPVEPMPIIAATALMLRYGKVLQRIAELCSILSRCESTQTR